MSYWAVVQCESQREHAVRLLLMRHGFATYAPRIKVRNRIGLLFPTYVFVHISDRWYPILWTPHVVRLLMSGDKPAQLKDEIVTHIRKREVGGFVKLPRPQALKPGQRIRIVNGAFQGQLGLYQGQTREDRVCVLMNMLGQAVSMQLPGKDIAPLAVGNVANAHRLR